MIAHQSRVDFELFASRTTSTTATLSKPVNATVHQPLSSGKVAPKRPDSLIGTARKHHSATPNHTALTTSKHACEIRRDPRDISIESKNGKLPSSSSGNKPAKRAAIMPPPATCHPLVISANFSKVKSCVMIKNVTTIPSARRRQYAGSCRKCSGKIA